MGRVDEAGLIDLWEEIGEDPHFNELRNYAKNIRLVPGIGASRPNAMVVGEAPGATENAQGRPFCGSSGEVLHQLMGLAGLYAEERMDGALRRDPNVWLTNTVKYRPPGNRTPILREILAATPHLRREWSLVGKPRLIVCVGTVAAVAIGPHMPSQVIRGNLYPLKTGYIAYQYHPAWGLRGGNDRKEMMERQWEEMGRQIEEVREELRWR